MSADVPPTSMVIRSSVAADAPAMLAADHAGGRARTGTAAPAAGARPAALVSPPRDCITCSGAATPASREALLETRQIAVDDRLQIGIEGGDDGALVFAERRIDLVRQRQHQARDGAARISSAARRSCAGLAKENRKTIAIASTPSSTSSSTARRSGRLVERRHDRRPSRIDALGHLLAIRGRAPGRPASPGSSTTSYIWRRNCRPISSTSRKPCGRDQADAWRPCAPAPHWWRPSCRARNATDRRRPTRPMRSRISAMRLRAPPALGSPASSAPS